MKKYYKNNIWVNRPKSLILNGKTYCPPTDEQLIEAGYKIIEEVYVEPEIKPLTNEDIKKQRELAYKATADSLFIAYKAYLELAEYDKANEMKELWLAERERIDNEHPYKTKLDLGDL